MGELTEGRTYPLKVEGYASDGAGVARWQGQVVFVRGALRGEVCETFIEKVGRSACWGRAERVDAPSPRRRASDCPYAADCGGCQLRHMSYDEELEFKRQRVEDALRRIGGLEVDVCAIHGAENTQRYRNKAQFPVSAGPKVGFYRRRTHQVIDVADCLLQPKAAAALRGAAKEWMERWHVPAYDERTGQGLVRHVYVRTNRAGESLFCLLVNGGAVPREAELTKALRQAQPGLVGAVLGINEKKNNVILGERYRTLWGRDYLMDSLCGLSFRVSVPSFYQVNAAQTEVLYEKARELAGLTGGETVLDLYCGIGTIGLTMAREAGQVIGAEVVAQAVEDARANAARNDIRNARFLCADAGEAAAQLAREGVHPQVVCVDPPRKGLGEGVADTIAGMGPERVVYVSCDPATLARDLRKFAALGYRTVRAEAVDLFPRTVHVETVCLLVREPGNG